MLELLQTYTVVCASASIVYPKPVIQFCVTHMDGCKVCSAMNAMP